MVSRSACVVFMLFLDFVFTCWAWLIDLVVFNVEQLRVRNSKGELRVLHGLEIHLEAFEVNQQQLRPGLDHKLACGHLLGVAAFAVEFVAEVQQLFGAEFLEAVAETDVPVDVDG